MAKGETNLYRCERCNGTIVTIDRDDGTTPMMLRCRARIDCDGMMQSSWYQGMADLVPSFEWRKPTKNEYRKMSAAMRDHVDMGGLDLYPIEQEARAATVVPPRPVSSRRSTLLSRKRSHRLSRREKQQKGASQ